METAPEEIRCEQQDPADASGLAEGPPEALAEHPLELEPAAELPALNPEPRPRGRPWVKGQSGNPTGRPRRIHPPAAVTEYVLGRKTIPLAKKVRDLALAGDKTMLKLWFQHVAQPRRGGPDWAGLPLMDDGAELRRLREAVAEAAEKGAITQTQADALVRIVNTVMGML
jgi:hypothetical protein